MADQQINWTRVCYVVGACWLISLALYVASEVEDFPLNPIPKVAAGIFGIVVYGYIGAGDAYEGAMILLYATLVGLWLALWLEKIKVNAAVIIGITIGIHLIFSAVCIPLLMLAGGR